MPLRRLSLVLCLGFVLSAFVLPTGSAAPEPTSQGRRFDPKTVLGPVVENLGNGHFKVRLRDGKTLFTHGPDFATSHGTSLGPGDPERTPVCATDYYQHVLYGRPSSAPDRFASVKADIQRSMRRIDAVLNEASIESGNKTADYKVLCDSTGQVQVDTFTNSRSSSFTDILNAARAAGYDESNVDYTIYYDGAGPSGVCGLGSVYADERLTINNANNVGEDYGISYTGCWDMIPMHENGHNQGAVGYNAPNGTGSWHCQDELDVMCYADGGPLFTGLVNRCLDKEYFDCGYDDYFDSAPEAGEYLATHWNMGSTLNRFIKFGPTGSNPDPVTTDPDPGTSTLLNGAPLTGVNGSSGTWNYYKISVPSGQPRLQVGLDGPACSSRSCRPNLDLYVRRDSKPSTGNYICRSRNSSSDELCTVTGPSSGWYYVGVYVSKGPSGSAFTVEASYP